MDNLKFQRLDILVDDGDPIHVKWLGVSQARDPASALNPYFEKMAEELVGKSVVVDFRELEYMNSSTVSPIVAMCQLFNQKGITTVLRYDQESSWQTATFRALITLSRIMEHVTVE